jgi:hypothetical protein
MGMGCLDSVFLLLFLYLLQNLGETFLLNLVTVAFILYLFVFVGFLNVLLENLVLFVLIDFALFVYFHLFAHQRRNLGFVTVSFNDEFFQLVAFNVFCGNRTLLVGLKHLCLGFELV